VALVWQVLTFLLPMGLVLGLWHAVIPAAVLSAGLLGRSSRLAAIFPGVAPVCDRSPQAEKTRPHATFWTAISAA